MELAPSVVRILALLNESPRTVKELVRELDLSLGTVRSGIKTLHLLGKIKVASSARSSHGAAAIVWGPALTTPPESKTSQSAA